MFEGLYVDPHKSHIKNKHQRLRRLLRRYVELQRLNVNQNGNGQTLEINHHNQNKNLSQTKVLNALARRVNDTNSRPEETYEIWEGLDHVNSNLKRRQDVRISTQSSEDPQTNHQPQDDQENNYDRNNDRNQTNDNNQVYDNQYKTSDNQLDTETETLLDSEIHDLLHSTQTPKSWVKSNFLVAINGLETFPVSKSNYTLYHTNNIRNLLHINILRGNWSIAYRLFCLLIRMNHVDIRSVWPLGVEILRHLGKSSALVAKDERFFEWLSNFFTISKASLNLIRDVSAPIWRSGSKYHVPLYIMSFMWLLLARKKYSKLLDKVEELVLEPPFNSEGVFFYLQALGILGQAMEDKSITDNNVAKIRQSVSTAIKLGFVVPMDYIDDKLKSFNDDMKPGLADSYAGDPDDDDDDDPDPDDDESPRSDIRSNEIYHVSPYGYEENNLEHNNDSITDAQIVMDDFMSFDSYHEMNSLD